MSLQVNKYVRMHINKFRFLYYFYNHYDASLNSHNVVCSGLLNARLENAGPNCGGTGKGVNGQPTGILTLIVQLQPVRRK